MRTFLLGPLRSHPNATSLSSHCATLGSGLAEPHVVHLANYLEVRIRIERKPRLVKKSVRSRTARPVFGWLGAGSSPRWRGTHRTPIVPRHSDRFIPAQAGNTLPNADRFRPNAVHPRAGGEHLLIQFSDDLFSGSSPRRRGTLLEHVLVVEAVRFIPAQAGNTSRFSRYRRSSAVHPRAGGEHVFRGADIPFGDGSSPRRRGTHSSRPDYRL